MKPSAHRTAAERAPAAPPPEPRRGFLGFLAGLVGTLVGLFPVVAGGIVFLDPVLRRKPGLPPGEEADPHASGKPYLRVASLSSVPDNGQPIQVPVISDLVDAWNLELNQPVGAVYLVRHGDEITAFNAICPHAGCFVGYAAERNCFQCPCHTSSFEIDGGRIFPSPSPRDMDKLKVDPERLKEGEVWVQFRNFYPGKAECEEKA